MVEDKSLEELQAFLDEANKQVVKQPKTVVRKDDEKIKLDRIFKMFVKRLRIDVGRFQTPDYVIRHAYLLFVNDKGTKKLEKEKFYEQLQFLLAPIKTEEGDIYSINFEFDPELVDKAKKYKHLDRRGRVYHCESTKEKGKRRRFKKAR